MASNERREELVLGILAQTGVPLDPESVAATYDTPLENWESVFERLESTGDVERVGDGLYRLTIFGQERVRPCLSRESSPRTASNDASTSVPNGL